MSKMIAERYMVVDSLGEGGMADVYLAMDTILNREVAVKVLRGELSQDPVALIRFLREASAVSKMHHPNVVEVFDVGEYKKQNYLVMEYVRGRTLKQLILQRGALQKEEAIEIMTQLVSAVAHAHEKNIIHRDVKPQNVLVKDDGTVKITDFGISLAHDAVQLTQSDSVLGSAHYIAPETTKGEVSTVQIDIYALGIVFYELLSGRVPFNGENPIQVAMKHLHEEVPSVREFNPTLPQGVENIIIKATAKNRKLRYQSATEMLSDLETVLLPENANVEKLDLTKELDDEGTKIMDKFNTTSIHDTFKSDKESLTKDNDEDDDQKDNKKLKIMLAILAVLVVLGTSFGIMVATGVISFEEEVIYVEVPDFAGMSLEEVKELIEELGLVLDEEITYESTEDTEEGLVYEQVPASNKEVKKGTSVKISISEGIFFMIGDYKGMTKDELIKVLQGTNISIVEDFQISTEVTPGTIISQSGLNPGDKIDMNDQKQIRIVVAEALEFFVEIDYTGMDAEVVKSSLESKGIVVEIIEQELEMPGKDATEEEGEPTEEEMKEYEDKLGTIFKQNPIQGTYYTQTNTSVFTLWCYK